jgi:alanine racemase
VDCYAVALIEEGIELRQSGIDKEILVLIPPFMEDVERAIYYDLTLTVENKGQIIAIEKECKRQKRKAKIHIKYDTGMNRLGVKSVEILQEILEFSLKCKWIIVDGVFSHFANPKNKKSLQLAQDKFLLANNLVKRYNKNITCHISASGGFLSGVFFDMVRVGILLYGYKPFKSDSVLVKPIMKVVAPVINNKVLKKGESALYGEKKSKVCQEVALVRCGYADGFSRTDTGIFSNRCMDASLYLSSGAGGEVTVMENADEAAAAIGTISYEVLTKSAIRAEKIYIY